MDTRTKETIRYLGYGKCAVDEKTLAMIQDSFQELEEIARVKLIYRIFDLSFENENCIRLGHLNIESKNLYRNLKGCEKVLVLGATLGIGVDMLAKRYAVTDMAKAVVLQAAAAAFLEEYLDQWQEELKQKFSDEHAYLRPRFSPGYGDFSIIYQKEVLDMLDASKQIGLTLTEGYMLAPTKSVTAVIGISDQNTECHKHGCETCNKEDCTYRRI